MRIFIACLFLVVTLQTTAIGQTTEKNDTTFDPVFTVVQIESEFPGGQAGWVKYLQANLNAELGSRYIKIPRKEKFAKQTVMVTFFVSRDGTISNVQADGINAHPKLIEEAIRVIKEGPNWVPAIQNGKKVTSRKRQAITWQVSKE